MLNRDRAITRKDWDSRVVESILITGDLSEKKVEETVVFFPLVSHILLFFLLFAF